MRARYGWSPRGSSANVVVSALRSRNITVFCAISTTGYIHFEHHIGAGTAIRFHVFLTALLGIMASQGKENCIFVMDNARIHKSPEIRQIITASGHALNFLPPYCPFLNPIEESFYKWKQLVRAGSHQTEDELMALVASCSTRITAEDCQQYYRHSFSYFQRCMLRENIEN